MNAPATLDGGDGNSLTPPSLLRNGGAANHVAGDRWNCSSNNGTLTCAAVWSISTAPATLGLFELLKLSELNSENIVGANWEGQDVGLNAKVFFWFRLAEAEAK